MWNFIKIALFIAYIIYAYNFMNEAAHEGGIGDAILSLIIAVVAGGIIYSALWIWPKEDGKKNTKGQS